MQGDHSRLAALSQAEVNQALQARVAALAQLQAEYRRTAELQAQLTAVRESAAAQRQTGAANPAASPAGVRHEGSSAADQREIRRLQRLADVQSAEAADAAQRQQRQTELAQQQAASSERHARSVAAALATEASFD